VKTSPLRGQIAFVALPQDPPGKGPRPVIIVSLDGRNRHPRAHDVLVVPLSTSIHKADYPAHLFLSAGETGLSADSIARAEDITVVAKSALFDPRIPLRVVSNRRICELAEKVKFAMGCA
jgi:mRNA-degrading endonuclease toxin of MazEF toxin-antitoxin module